MKLAPLPAPPPRLRQHIRGPLPTLDHSPRRKSSRRRTHRPSGLRQQASGSALGLGLRLSLAALVFTGMTAVARVVLEQRRDSLPFMEAVKQTFGWGGALSQQGSQRTVPNTDSGVLFPWSGKHARAAAAPVPTFSQPATEQSSFASHSEPLRYASASAASRQALASQAMLLAPSSARSTVAVNRRVNRSAAAGITASAIGPVTNAAGQSLIVDAVNGNSPYPITVGDQFVNVTVGDTTTGTLNQTDGYLLINNLLTVGNSAGSNGTYVLGGGGSIYINGTYGSTFTPGTIVIGNQGAGTFTQNAGTVTGGLNNYYGVDGTVTLGSAAGSSGTYNLNGGTLQLGKVAAGNGVSTFNFNGGTLKAGPPNTAFLQGLTTANVRAGGAIIDSSGVPITVAQNLLHDTTIGAPALDGGLTVRGDNGFGKLTLTGVNTYNGGTTLAGGTLVLGSAGAVGTSGAIKFTGGTLQFSAANTTDYSGRFANTVNQQVSVDTGGQNVTFANGFNVAGGSLTKLGAGTLTVLGQNNVSNGTTLGGGTLNLGNAGALGTGGTINFTGGTLQFSAANTTDYSSRFSTASSQPFKVDTNGQNVTFATGLGSQYSSLIKSGAGTLTLTGANAYTGSTVVSGGALVITGATSTLGSSNTTFSVVNGGSASIDGKTSILSNGIFIGSDTGTSTFTQSGNSIVSSGSYNSIIGSGTPGSIGSAVYNLQGGTFTSLVTFVGGSQNSPTTVFNQTGGVHKTAEIDFNGYLSTNSAYNLSGGTLNTNAVKFYQAPGTFNFNGGTLQAAGNNAVFGYGNAMVVQVGGAKIDTNGFNAATGGLIHDPASGAPAIDGGLTKLGAGTLSLSGANTYTGPTVVSAGTLLLNGSLGGAGAVTVAGGSTLAVTGAIAGSVSVQTGGMLTLISNTQTLSVGGSLTLASTATTTFILGGKSSGTTYYSRINVGGQTDLGGATLNIALAYNYIPTLGDKFYLIDTTGSSLVTGTFSTGSVFYQDGVTYLINYADTDPDSGSTPAFSGVGNNAVTPGNDISIMVIAVPEPGMWAMLAAGMVLLMWTIQVNRRQHV